MKNKRLLERLYKKPTEVPWHSEEPPQEVKKLAGKKIKLCKILDIGCGAGTISIYLAKKGFDVTGIDLSEKAIGYAKRNAKINKVKAKFEVLDALKLEKINDRFDAVIEWGLMHWIPFSEREKYVKGVSKVLNKNGLYLSLSFSMESKHWGLNRIRKGASGANLYFSTAKELKELFKKQFKIIEIKRKKTLFKNLEGEYIHNYLLMKKR